MSDTPLRRWLRRENKNSMDLAIALKVQQSRVIHWINGGSAPRGPLFLKLMKLTGLTVAQLLPSEAIRVQRLRRRRALDARAERQRRRSAALTEPTVTES